MNENYIKKYGNSCSSAIMCTTFPFMPTSESMTTCRGWSDMASEENFSRKNPDNLGKWGIGVFAPSSLALFLRLSFPLRL